MPIYEYYCPDNNTIYQFFAKTLAQGKLVPKCPDNPKFRLQKTLSTFAVKTGGKKSKSGDAGEGAEGAPAASPFTSPSPDFLPPVFTAKAEIAFCM